jgi:hypothetical protein
MAGANFQHHKALARSFDRDEKVDPLEIFFGKLGQIGPWSWVFEKSRGASAH